MPIFTVILPTIGRIETLIHVLPTIQAQTLTDFELFIIGDGVDEERRSIIETLIASDARISYFHHPKGNRRGETYRHAVLQRASGKFIAYATDDDVWLPDHLENFAPLLETYDLVHCIEIFINRDDTISVNQFNANCAMQRLRLAQGKAGFGLATAAHTLSAYQKLPHGWRTTPPDIFTDCYMWLQFLEQEWCHYYSSPWPTVVHFPTILRKDMTASECGDEIAKWLPHFKSPESLLKITKSALKPFIAELQKQAIKATATQTTLALIDNVSSATDDAKLFGNPNLNLLMNSGSFGCSYLLYGFNLSESWGTWTNGKKAAFTFPIPASLPQNPHLELNCLFFISNPIHQECRFSICIDDGPTYSFIEKRWEGTIRIPLPEILKNKMAIARILIDNPCNPSALGISPDTRDLGIGLISACVK